MIESSYERKYTMLIQTLQDLCDHFGADTPQGLNRRIYKDTACGASISIRTPDRKWHHNGQDWSGITEIVSFTLQTIIEGSDATVDADEIALPVESEKVAGVLAWIEDEADQLWHEANGEEVYDE